jgi:hypothetical protein
MTLATVIPFPSPQPPRCRGVGAPRRKAPVSVVVRAGGERRVVGRDDLAAGVRWSVSPESPAFVAWLRAEQARVDAETARRGSPTRSLLIVDQGRRYLRVAVDTGAQRFAHAFVDMTTGDVLRPEGWSRPARGIRGNVHAALAQ